MPILNMIAQGSGGGWWGSNVWEPTNLSAMAISNSSIEIKWTDNNLQAIPPSTFQKSVLVRKIGSAPTTPSDWTMVVTETVMNTYQSSGYSDTWLTDWTTYYYQVFSYSTDWGITYWTPVSATPQRWWTPWANTVLYLPMNSTDNFSDQSWNWYIGTWTGTYSINTIDGTECWDFQVWYIRFTWLQNINANSFTHIFWGNTNRPWRWEVASYLQANSPNDAHSSFWISNGWYYFMGTNLYWWYDLISDINNRSWWQMLAFVKDWTDISIYINDEQPFTATWNSNSNNLTIFEIWGRNDVYSYQWWAWWLSNVILENKARTAQEVSDYYNQTKALYWIS